MPTGQPDPSARSRPFAPDPGGDGAADFLGLDQDFGPQGASWETEPFDGEEGAYDDPAYAEDAALEPQSFDEGTFDEGTEDGAWAGEAWDGQPAELAPDANAIGSDDEIDAFADLDFDLEEAEAASWLMELDEDSLDVFGADGVLDLEEAEPFLPETAQVETRRRSPWLLAAIVVISVGTGVGLSRAVSRFTGNAPLDGGIALGPAAPARTAPTARTTPPTPTDTQAPSTTPDATASTVATTPDTGSTAALVPSVTEPTNPPASSSPETIDPAPTVASTAQPILEPRTPTGPAVTLSEPTPGSGQPTAAVTPEPTPARTSMVPLPADPNLAPLRGPVREATAADLANVWTGTAIPFESLDIAEDLSTPYVGRVRVVTVKDEVYEGRLHAVGRGRVWLASGHGKMALMSWQIARMEHVLGDDSTPALGSRGSQDFAGLPSVRVRTPGGVFYGKLISQQGERVTLMTSGGARISLDNGIVELAGRSRTRVVDVVAEEAATTSQKD